jgi:hypothetical protein
MNSNEDEDVNESIGRRVETKITGNIQSAISEHNCISPSLQTADMGLAVSSTMVNITESEMSNYEVKAYRYVQFKMWLDEANISMMSRVGLPLTAEPLCVKYIVYGFPEYAMFMKRITREIARSQNPHLLEGHPQFANRLFRVLKSLIENPDAL